MQQETTREKPLESVSHELLSSGYQRAPLRIICRDAGAITGVLYFSFKDRSALSRALAKDAAETVMQMLYQHTSSEEEMYSNTDQLMGIEHDIRLAQELISFYYAHETALELLFSCPWESACQDFTERIITYLVKRNTKIISVMVKDDDTVLNACILHWLSQIWVETSLHTLSHHYFQEQTLHQIRIIVTSLRGGFEGLYQQAVKDQIRGILPFPFTAQHNSVMLCQAYQ